MYKVFFNNNTIFFTDKISLSEVKYNTIAIQYDESMDFEIIVNKLYDPARQGHFVIVHPDFEKVFQKFSSHFKIIEAAGGMIINASSQFLGIYRRNHWDLPKGKIDHHESIEEGGLRECREETHLDSLIILDKITITYHCYTKKEKNILKPTHWFLVKLIRDEIPEPELEEDITETRWFDFSDFELFTENTYGTILEVLKSTNVVSLT